MQLTRDEIAESASFTKNPAVAVAALRSTGHIFNAEQQQRLVDTLANGENKRFASQAIVSVEQLTRAQKVQLVKAISPE